ncbi:hypothetical protein [Thioalkalivibrio thiocyanodenitrificans]|uniref:hypothetical protein n=1 Tax=Thioalkalivibrio thiocyanodenitrificans TaxID=243063 RepID=UPI000369A3F5|nr:hypothetical protein [Thioalkalivibrio thiocyanodenitrificans]
MHKEENFNERQARMERRFQGIGELERTGYIPAGSADERNAMSVKQRLLVCLTELCTELAQASTRAQQFGLKDARPGPDATNSQDMARVITELVAVIDLCREHGIAIQPGDAKAIYDAK